MFQPAKAGDTVTVHYTGRLADGTIFDTSRDKRPLRFILGTGEVIQGFEEAVSGMVRGEQKTVTISPEAGYGASRPELVETVERNLLPADMTLQAGAQLEVTRQDGSTFLVMVREIAADQVTLDANHPLAGRELVFDIEVLEITPPPRH